MSLSIYHTLTHSLGCMSERISCRDKRERDYCCQEIILLFWGFNLGADSISQEVVGFSPFMVSPKEIFFVHSLLCLIVVLVILLAKDPNIMLA